VLHKFYQALLTLWLSLSLCIVTGIAFGQTDDAAQLKQQAQLAYFTVPSYAMRRIHEKTQYLFLAPDPKREHDATLFGFDTAKLVLAEHSAEGKTSILWQYDLPQGGVSVCWWNENSEHQNAIFVEMYGGEYSTFAAPINDPPSLINTFQFADSDHHLIENVLTTFVSPQQLNLPDHIFYSSYALIALNLTKGSTTDISRLSDFRETSSNFLAVRDVDGDGTIDIIGDSGRYVGGKAPQFFPSTFRVWHYLNGQYVQIYQSAPHDSIVTGSIPFQYAKTARPAMLAQEAHFPGLKNAPQETRYALHLYQWDGKAITELANTVGLLPGQLYGAFVAADLRGDGVQEVVTMFVKDSPQIAVLDYKNHQFVKVWESPPLDYNIEFGRPDNYRGAGQQIPLTDPDTGGKRLFRFAGGKYVGWERMLKPPPPPAPSPPALETRFHWEERGMMSNTPKHLLILDGNPLIQVFANTRELNAEYRAEQIQKRVLDLAKQKYPPAQVIARKVGDEDEEPKMEVAAGTTVIITLTESEAKTAGKPLNAYAQEWAGAVRLALMTLAKPPK